MNYQLIIHLNNQRKVFSGNKLKAIEVSALEFIKDSNADDSDYAIAKIKKHQLFFRTKTITSELINIA